MSGVFSDDWLALREPADAQARNTQVMALAAHHLQGLEAPRICDLACGTGATLRGLSPLLPSRQVWRLVDNDPALLSRARSLLEAWADGSTRDGDGLVMEKDGKRITVTFQQADLALTPAPWPAGTDLVTASALFDLTSRQWMDVFVERLVADSVPLLALLSYDGRVTLDPPHRNDGRILAAFNHHQLRDKGFGDAAGPNAAGFLVQRLAASDWRIDQRDSDWRLNADQSLLMTQAIAGWVSAAAEEGVDSTILDGWRAERKRALRGLHIGHTDMFARPAS